MNMTMRQIRAFAAVAEHGSFTAAARQLHLTQSALSVLVRELERELGVRLFDRSTRRVQLTTAGRDLGPHVERALRELHEAVDHIARLRDKRRGFLRVAAPQLVACTLIPPAIAVWRERFPAVEVELKDTLPEGMLAEVLLGRAELGVAGHAASELSRRTLLKDRHWLVCRPDDPLATQRELRWSALRDRPFIAPTQRFIERLEAACAEHANARAPVPTAEASFTTTALGMVQSGLGLTACPTYAAPLIKAYGLKMVPLVAPVFYREVCIYSVPGKSLSPAAESFVELLHEFARRRPDDLLWSDSAVRTRRKAGPRE